MRRTDVGLGTRGIGYLEVGGEGVGLLSFSRNRGGGNEREGRRGLNSSRNCTRTISERWSLAGRFQSTPSPSYKYDGDGDIESTFVRDIRRPTGRPGLGLDTRTNNQEGNNNCNSSHFAEQATADGLFRLVASIGAPYTEQIPVEPEQRREVFDDEPTFYISSCSADEEQLPGTTAEGQIRNLFSFFENAWIIRDVIPYGCRTERDRVFQQISRPIHLRTRGIRIISTHAESTYLCIDPTTGEEKEDEIGHIHIVHDCTYHRGSCRCAFMQDFPKINLRRNKIKIPKEEFDFWDFVRQLIYYSQDGRQLTGVYAGNRKIRVPDPIALLEDIPTRRAVRSPEAETRIRFYSPLHGRDERHTLVVVLEV